VSAFSRLGEGFDGLFPRADRQLKPFAAIWTSTISGDERIRVPAKEIEDDQKRLEELKGPPR
jgi:hypothetical protein